MRQKGFPGIFCTLLPPEQNQPSPVCSAKNVGDFSLSLYFLLNVLTSMVCAIAESLPSLWSKHSFRIVVGGMRVLWSLGTHVSSHANGVQMLNFINIVEICSHCGCKYDAKALVLVQASALCLGAALGCVV